MCGIACAVGKNNLHLLPTMLARIKHRGPDGLHLKYTENFGFGHARLSIIDLSNAASQPMVDESDNIIIFNGEIYNYIELKKQLSNNYQFKTDSDTEVILAAYQKWGAKCVEYLRGMFTIILHDKKLDKLFIARDRFGIKPLYIRTTTNGILFSSEIKSLVHHYEFSDTLNETKAAEFLIHRRLDTNTETFIKEIKQLKQGCYVWVNNKGEMSQEFSYWKFPALGTKDINSSTFQNIYEKLNDTVNIHLRSDVPVGSFLSGGVDSSVLTAMSLQNVENKNWHTFSAILPYYHAENALIKDFHLHYPNIHQHNYNLSGDGFFDDIEKIIYHHDEPILDGSMYAHYQLCKIASEAGVKVIFSGSGGDELFAGYKSYVDAGLAQKLKSLHLFDYCKMVNELSVTTVNAKSSLIKKSIWELLPASIKSTIKENKTANDAKIVSKKYQFNFFPYNDPNPYQANLLNNYYSWTVPPYLHYEDRNCMAHGVEVRVPFLDHELIEFVLQYKFDNFLKGNTKSILRESVRNILPKSIVDQKGKFGFPSPIDHALKNDKRGKEMFFDYIKNISFINQEEAENLANKFYNKGSNENTLTLFWRTLSFSIWYYQFFKK